MFHQKHRKFSEKKVRMSYRWVYGQGSKFDLFLEAFMSNLVQIDPGVWHEKNLMWCRDLKFENMAFCIFGMSITKNRNPLKKFRRVIMAGSYSLHMGMSQNLTLLHPRTFLK